jgi:UrcA family protein
MTVNYADLDLSTPAGVEALYDRIKMASRKVCNALEGNPTHPAWRSCYLGTVSKAIATVDRPTLTALHKATRTAKG